MRFQFVFLISFLLIIICMSSIAHCDLLDNIVDRNIITDITGISRVSVFGVVECPFPALVTNEPSLPAGLNVVLTCDKGRTVISNAVTDTQGFFRITLNTLQTSLFHPNQCDECRLSVRGHYGTCILYPGRHGALFAPINCRDVVVEQLHGDEQGRDNVMQYKGEPFYFDPRF